MIRKHFRNVPVADPAEPGRPRRKSERLSRAIAVHYRVGDAPYRRSQTVDFSVGGAKVWVNEPLQADTNICMLFDLAPKLKLTVTARLVWQFKDHRKGHVAGLAFELPGAVEGKLRRWVNRQLKAS